MIDDFQHVSITCRDLERSVRFYERLERERGKGRPAKREDVRYAPG
jgi:catechol 2,3-dioxygenase-like lactoylglutathione lyase family enzyme